MGITSRTGEVARLRDGSEVVIARLTPEDAPLLADAFARLSEESRRLRFLGPKPSLSASELRYLTQVDGHRHEALSALDPATARGVAIGRFVRDPRHPERAEVAITVADDWQRRGLGKLLLERLAERARREGVGSFTALVSVDNRNMRGLLERIDAPAHVAHVADGVAEWEVELAPRGLGDQLEEMLRAAAAGHLQIPPRLCEVLRTLVPLRLERRLPERLEQLPRRIDLRLPHRR
ncbi:MAG: GNAT family N-acetyltransferase [Solirubrobacterales bacterium]|nr:GNAT family N-acetyltransferase [Solirubrobacterales bacterium]